MRMSREGVTRRTWLRWMLYAGGAIGIAAACGPGGAPSPSSRSSTAKRGGVLTTAQQNDWEGFDPHRQTSTPYAFPLIYNALVSWKVQPDGSVKAAPDLATEWTLKDDAAIFKLRQGVRFHDGSDWTAEVAKFNIERLKAPKSTAASFVSSIRSAEVVDRYTLKLNLTGPAGSLLSNLSQAADERTYMISKAMAEKVGDKYGTSPETTAGTGPMRLTEWVPGSHHIAKRTGEHWVKGLDGMPLPYYETFKARFVKDDSVRVVELRSGNVDVIDNIAAKDVTNARNDAGIDLIENKYQVGARQFTFSTKKGVLASDPRLRQAVHYALDREAMAKVLGQGIGAPMYYFLTPGYLGYDDKLPRYTHDVQRSKRLLADAGYAKGIDIQLSVINREVDIQQAQVMRQMLGEAGIRVTFDTLERIAWVNKMKTGEYEMSTYFTTTRPDPDSILAGRFQTGEGKNYAGMSDKAMDQLLEKGRSSYDDKTRAAAYRDVQKRIFETAWFGTMWFSRYYDGYRKLIKGRTPTQESVWDLREAWADR
jgi:peptide/nickel transport system substrate-binding protein